MDDDDEEEEDDEDEDEDEDEDVDVVETSLDFWIPFTKSDLASWSCRALMNMNVES